MTIKFISPAGARSAASAARSTRSSRSRSARSASGRSSPRTTCSRRRRRFSASRRRPGPRTLWRYESLLPGGPGHRARRSRRRVHAAASGGRTSPSDWGWRRSGSRTTRSTRRTPSRIAWSRRHHHGARVRLRGRLVRVHRQPGERDRRACGEGRHACYVFVPDDLERAKILVDRGVRGEGGRRQRQLRRREPALLGGRGGAAVGVRQREHAAVLRGGLEVARVRDRRAARLAAARSRRRAHRVGGAADEDPPRVRRAHRDRRGRGEALPRVGGAGRGVLARSRGVRRRRDEVNP